MFTHRNGVLFDSLIVSGHPVPKMPLPQAHQRIVNHTSRIK